MTTSIRSRFAFTVGANLVRTPISFATGILLARWLGPQYYGKMAFLIGTFIGIRLFLDMGSSSAFFTFLSQRPRSKRFVTSFYVWLALQLLIPLFVIALLFPAQWIGAIWHGEHRNLVLLAFVATFMQNSVWPVIQQAGESQRQTRWVQGVGTVVVLSHLLAVVLFWWLGILGLYALFAVIALEYLLAGLVVNKRFSYAPADVEVCDETPEHMLRKYINYCLPMMTYTCVSSAYEFADRWLLQRYGGNVEQAYYAVGTQFGTIALIATTSILNIFWKEIAEAHHNGNHARMAMLYQKVSRLLFLIGAVVAGFLIPWSAALLKVLLGAAYMGGATTLTIMFLYPIHQSLGQIGGTMLYATERVSIRAVSGITIMIVSMVVTYFVLAPRDAILPGLGMASEGLAYKMVIMQIIGVNILAYIIARIWKWRFDWVYQPVSLLGCVCLGWAAKYIVTLGAVGYDLALPLGMGLAGMLYLVFIAGFVYSLPWLAGMTRVEFIDNVRHLWQGTMRFFRQSAE